MTSLNPYAPAILKTNVFKNIKNFYDFEKRIENISSIGKRGVETTKGDVFEIFIEALLKSNKKYLKEKVYPSFSTPFQIKDQLSLSLKKNEMGFDGVYLDQNKYSTYQVKYRNKEKGTLTWRDLSTFIGVSEKANYRHLFTNIEKISEEFKSKKNVIITSRKDLINLKSFEFKEIEYWLYKISKKIKKHKPEKYQLEAVDKIVGSLKNRKRTTAILACGTGKTNIALWAYEKIKPKIALVFVPSIALIKQIRADWLEQISINNIKTLQVCSFKQSSKREDQIILSSIDLDFQVTTESETISSFLEKNKKFPIIIFSTYQSSLSLSKGIKNRIVDFAFFDEAHRTSRINFSNKPKITGYTLPLYDKYIKIKKRLFMTATRRISNPLKQYDSGDNKITYSMENKDLYGDICYTLSFKKAAELGIIAKFKIVLNFVNKKEIELENRKRGITIINGDEVKSEHSARQLALAKAIKKYNLSKIFTFHRTIARSKQFTSKGNDGVNVFLENFNTDHIQGSMKIQERENIMEKFINSKKAIVSNARCLIEGVDVPSVEMVAFLDNKNSEIDIVQAAGRALRNRGQNKKFGYIFVPIFIEKSRDQKIINSIDESEFENVIQVLRAMSNHDEEIAQIIALANYEIKKLKGISYKTKKKIGDFFDLSNVDISKSSLEKFITTKAFSRVNTSWDEKIIELREYKKIKGHTNVTPNDIDFRLLYRWTQKIRERYKKNELFNFQITELEREGFLWSRSDVKNFDKNTHVPLRWFTKYAGGSVLNKAVRDKILISKGKIASAGGAFSVYKKLNSLEFKKLFNITHFFNEIKKDDLHTLSSLSKITGFGVTTINLYIKKNKIKPEGRSFGTGSGNKKNDKINFVSLYKKFTDKEVMSYLNIQIKDTSKYYSLTEYQKKLGFSKIIEKALPFAGNGISSNGISKYYYKISQKEIEKKTGYKLKQLKNLKGKKFFYKHSKLPKNILDYLFKNFVKPIDTSDIKDLKRSFYINYSDEELLKFIGVKLNFFNKSILLDQLIKDYKIKYSMNIYPATFKKIVLNNKVVKPILKFDMGRMPIAYYLPINLKKLKIFIPEKYFNKLKNTKKN